jgi:hypothetical protein
MWCPSWSASSMECRSSWRLSSASGFLSSIRAGSPS